MSVAYAMGQVGGGSGNVGGFASFIPLILMFVIFYFLLIRPQQKKNKNHREMINSLKVGDKVIVSNSIYGRIIGVSEDTIVVEIADGIKIKVIRNSVTATLKNIVRSAS